MLFLQVQPTSPVTCPCSVASWGWTCTGGPRSPTPPRGPRPGQLLRQPLLTASARLLGWTWMSRRGCGHWSVRFETCSQNMERGLWLLLCNPCSSVRTIPNCFNFAHFHDGVVFCMLSCHPLLSDAERVIHCLLEGSLPSDVACLDPVMPLKAAAGKAGKGKGKDKDKGKGKGKAALDTHKDDDHHHSNGAASSTVPSTHLDAGVSAAASATNTAAAAEPAWLRAQPARQMARATAKVLGRVKDEERCVGSDVVL